MTSQVEPCAELMLDNQLCFALYSTSLMMTKTYKPLLQALGLTLSLIHISEPTRPY